MLRKTLLSTALAMPVLAFAPSLALAADQAQDKGQSYGQQARDNQPESVQDIDGLNDGPREAAQFLNKSVGAGDATFALPATALIGDDLRTGDETDAGDIEDVVLADDGSIMAAVDLEDGDTVLVPFSAIRVQTGRGPENWMLITGLSPDELGKLQAYDDDARKRLTSVSDALMGAEVTAGDQDVGSVSDAVIHSTAGIQGLVIDAEDHTVMVPAKNVTVRAAGDGALTISTDMSAEQLAGLPKYVFGKNAAAITAPGSEAAGLPGEAEIGDSQAADLEPGQPTASQSLPQVTGDAQMKRPMQAEGGDMDKVLEIVREPMETESVD